MFINISQPILTLFCLWCMNEDMKYFFLFVVLIFAFSFVLFSQQEEYDDATIAYPGYRNPIINDGRSECEKTADITFDRSWWRICSDSGQNIDCSLPKSLVNSILIYRSNSFASCSSKM